MLHTSVGTCAVLLAVIITGILVPLTTTGSRVGVLGVVVVFAVTFVVVALVLRRIQASSR